MNYPKTVEELIHWDISQGKDSFGTYTIITGFEGTGGCFWCGKKLEGRRRFCGHQSGHWTRYQEHFNWGYARAGCLNRYKFRCANCGTEAPEMPLSYWEASASVLGKQLKAHHIIPLEGIFRAMSPFNISWNLICLCHRCHLEIHTLMRELTKPAIKDMFELARDRGQAVFDIS